MKQLILFLTAMALSAPVWAQATSDPLYPPFLETFDDSESYGRFQTINANNDDTTFEIADGCAKLRFCMTGEGDDWLILPAIYLEAGNGYPFSCDVWCHLDAYPERFEVKVAKEATVEALENGTSIIEKTVVSNLSDNPYKAEAIFKPETDGVYYIGIHGCSDFDTYFLYIDNVSVDKGMNGLVPASVTNASAERDQTGSLAAKLTFTAPSVNFAGNDLTELQNIKIVRDSEELDVVNASPGQDLTYNDNTVTAGEHTYTLIPHNSYGDGVPFKLSVFVGFNVPKPSDNVTVAYGADAGKAVISWEPVLSDITGLQYPEGALTYKVLRTDRYTQETLAEGLTVNTYTDNFCEADAKQQAVYYSVVPVSSAGEGLPTNSTYFCLGAPYTLPFKESFANEELQNEVWVTDGNVNIAIYNDYMSSLFASQDKDNGFAYINNSDTSKPVSLTSGRISLAGAPGAELTFYSLAFRDNNDTKLEVIVDQFDGNPAVAAVFEDNGTEDNSFKWKERKVDLAQWAGKDIRVTFKIYNQAYAYFGLDNIIIKGQWENNLAIDNLSLPLKFVAGNAYSIPVTVTNIGKLDAEDYTIDLYRNGEKVHTANGETLMPGESTTVVFTEAPTSLSDNTVTYQASIGYAKEGNPSDNSTAEYIVIIRTLDLPSPGQITGKTVGSELQLSWEAAVIPDDKPGKVFNDLSDLTPFSCDMSGSALGAEDNIGDWSMIDNDRLPTISDLGIPVTNMSLPMAFIVFNGKAGGIDWEMFNDHSGDGNVFASFASVGGRNDDWLVSPRLNGEAQQVSFYIKSIDANYYERYEVYYSQSGKETEDFTIIDGTQIAEDAWTEKIFDLPVGTTYFAIRYISNDQFGILLDDFTYTPAAVGDGLELLGYNLYCDNVRINDTLLNEPSMSTETFQEGSEFKATAVYNRGESIPTAGYIHKSSGIEDAFANGISVKALTGSVEIKSAEGMRISIADIAGRQCYSAKSTGYDIIPLNPGIYLVSVDGSVTKIIIR